MRTEVVLFAPGVRDVADVHQHLESSKNQWNSSRTAQDKGKKSLRTKKTLVASELYIISGMIVWCWIRNRDIQEVRSTN